MRVLGLDIGGANIKASDADGHTTSMPFAMWQQKEELPAALRALAAEQNSPEMVALTLTAELADCFQTKAEGVEFVINAVEESFKDVPLRVWLTSGEFAEPVDARELPTLVSAANWQALATWAGRAVPDGPALLIDMGSTTTDIIPLLDGFPIPTGLNDSERLMSGELVYTGAARTPVCAIVDTVPLRGEQCPVAAEVFATVVDAFLLAGMINEDPDDSNTADGRPLTRPCSRNRLAHMVCSDSTELSGQDLKLMAEHVVDVQCRHLRAAISQVVHGLATVMEGTDQRCLDIEKPSVIISGSGAFVVEQLLQHADAFPFAERLSLSDMFRHPISESACAFAVARLAHDRCRDDLLEPAAL
ncbi:MAG: H4MPT-linked C1 transfer pathway protein [Fuerstiella sp.]|nr:H4MPT-linked C1 transfer pathway protein [Fuerstiella sp.]MCP4858919.1 H4MPT-linked C1 transfer pathway protein [Fuerstiella sp.]